MAILGRVLDALRPIKVVGRSVNRIGINMFAAKTPPRPKAYSLWSHVPKPPEDDVQGPVSDYTSWPGLTDRRWSGRHLKPHDTDYAMPKDSFDFQHWASGPITALFERSGPMKTDRSSLLFMFFAQWFTDSILRIDPNDRRKNTSNHDIDLCQIYGLDEDTCRLLRTRDESPSKRGKLRSQTIERDGHLEEYPEYLCEPDGAGGSRVKPHFHGLSYIAPFLVKGAEPLFFEKVLDAIPREQRETRKKKLYATGLERGNSSIGYVAISTIFLREHNRICDDLREHRPRWDDERVFQTARMINIVILMKLVVEDYINHILGYKLFRLDCDFAEKENWYRANWIALEFDLLYRWHSLVPDEIKANDRVLSSTEFRTNNALLEELGVGPLVDTVCRQRAGKVGLFNTPKFLWAAEYQSLKMARDFRLRPYNEYRTQFGLDPYRDYDELTNDAALASKLRDLYGPIDKLEYFVGLFAEKPNQHPFGESLFGELLDHMVAYDAFTQIFSNPLLSKNIYGKESFTEYGVDLIEETTSIEALVNRNVPKGAHVKAALGIVP